MKKLECYSSTSYKEIWDFLRRNIGKRVEFHYELKGYGGWGHDEIEEIFLNKAGLDYIKKYMGTEDEYRKTNDAYVHNITVL